MGGTFDPIHYGHLVAAQEARATFGLDSVLFVPCRQPPHRPQPPAADAEHRYAMTVLATCTNANFRASRIELERPAPSYSVDTLRQLHDQRPAAELFFITGADAVRELATWREPQRLIELARLVAIARPGYDLGGLERDLGEFARAVSPLRAPGVDISSTEIRQRVAQGRPIKYLTPEPVEAYIAKYGLYRGDDQSHEKGGDQGCPSRSTSATCHGA
jgi:nicotinate-nucleotide adenylyltransferase